MALNKKDRYVHCLDCGSRQEMNGVCKTCGHVDNPALPGMVPTVVGNALSTAKGKITHAEAQLVVGNVTEEHSETIAAGKVISTEPAEGTEVGIGTAVNIVVSLGPAT